MIEDNSGATDDTLKAGRGGWNMSLMASAAVALADHYRLLDVYLHKRLSRVVAVVGGSA
jgi:sugar (pentulose or hexulose) kinase